MILTLYIDNANDFYTPSVAWTLEGEPIEDAEIILTLGSKAESGVITDASGDDPIEITTAEPHGLATDDWVIITRVVGNKGANGVFQVTLIDSTTFSLQGSEHTGAYISGGVWYKAIPGVINLELVRMQETLYAGTFSRDVNLEREVTYIAVLDILNYEAHLEVDCQAVYRTG